MFKQPIFEGMVDNLEWPAIYTHILLYHINTLLFDTFSFKKTTTANKKVYLKQGDNILYV